MKDIIIQFQPALSKGGNKEEIVSILSLIGFTPTIEDADDQYTYINFITQSQNVEETWAKIKSSLLIYPKYYESCIVLCEGEDGWNDYLLLHHYEQVEEYHSEDDAMLGLEQLFSKNKSPEYWEARRNSKKQWNKIYVKIMCVAGIIIGTIWLLAALDHLKRDKEWIHTDALVTDVTVVRVPGTYVKEKIISTFQVRYEVFGELLWSERSYLHELSFKEGDVIKIIVEPDYPLNFLLADSSSLMFIFACALFILCLSLFYLFKPLIKRI